ncbi:MAG TPA: head GIN domain-containing protein [Anaerolineae bacterium]|nr:head GIN domain-containing protein [Anaerolineae bacterium]HOQ99004.1 head GIN domain-containing protein [Anaerolineae bacterium]HPL29524.1 head GIN domain-containing protein [Anaerolineae bacterium]
MKRMVLLSCLLVAVVAAGCCPLTPGLLNARSLVGSGRLETRELDLSGFSHIEAGSAFVLDVVQSEQFAVSITADDNLFDYLDAAVSGDTLRLRLRSGTGISRATLRARVAMPALRGLDLSGASRSSITGFSSAKGLDLELSGASSLQGDIKAGAVRVELSGASRLELTGSGEDLTLRGSGASTARLAGFPVTDARATLSGASRAELEPSGRLDADLSGASTLQYGSGATLGRVQTSGGSSIHAR